jgi:hypothetical protein
VDLSALWLQILVILFEITFFSKFCAPLGYTFNEEEQLYFV